MDPIFAPYPDWSAPVVERLEWLTDLQVGNDGTEQRTQLRAWPRYAYTWLASVTSDQSTPWAYLPLYRTPQEVIVPLWPHATFGAIPTRGAFLSAYQAQMQWLAFTSQKVPTLITWSTSVSSGTLLNGSYAGVNLAPYVIAAPAAPALLSVQRALSSITTTFVQYQIEARLTGTFFESAADPNVAATASALAAPPIVHDFSSAISEAISVNVITFDTGSTWSETTNYSKRQLGLQIYANGDTAIVALRQFLFACRGRLNSFSFTAPTDTVAGLWRLDQDTTELSFIAPTFAQCRLNIVQVG